MSVFFRRQLSAYADYHRDERNGLTHAFGIPIIFLAIVLPLSLWPIGLFGIPTNAATVLVALALVVWIALDVGVGLTMAVFAIALLLVAAAIASYANTAAVWIIAAVLFVLGWALQILGHARFEHRRPALTDNPVHLLIGPMFIVAKLLIALGLRPDLAAIIRHGPQQAAGGAAL
jgi:uncharacterized membrane protein YGL010W